MQVNKTHIEAEKNELILRNDAGDVVIIPAKYRAEVQDMIKDECFDCIDHLVDTLPVMDDYAEDGSLIPTDDGEDKTKGNKTSSSTYPLVSQTQSAPQPVWFYSQSKNTAPAVATVSAPNSTAKEPSDVAAERYVDMIFKDDIEKKAYWDSLPQKYGKYVQGRQWYMDLYDKKMPPIDRTVNIYMPTTDEADTNYVAENIPASILPLKTQYDETVKKIRNLYYDYSVPEDQKAQMKSDLVKQRESLYEEIINHPENQFTVEQPETTWKELISKRTDITNVPLFYASLMDEGAEMFTAGYTTKSVISGYDSFGLDTFGTRVDEFIKKGYLDPSIKDRLTIYRGRNDKQSGSEVVHPALFHNLDDVISAKNAFFKQGESVVNAQAKKLGLNLSQEAKDYFLVATYNLGEGGTRKMMSDFVESGLMEGEKFLKMENLEKDYLQVHRNITRRLQAARMLKGEGVIVENSNE